MRALVTRAWLYGLGILGVCGGIAAGCSAERGDTGPGAALDDVDAGAALQNFPDAMGLARNLAARKPELAKTLGDNPAVALRLNAGKFLPAEVEGSAGRAIGFAISERLSGASTFYAVDGMDSALELAPASKSSVLAGLEEGRAVYNGAFGNADLIVSPHLDRVEHTIVIRDSQSPDLFTWNWKLADGMYTKPTDGDRLGIFAPSGKPVLTIDAATILDAAGKSRSSLISFDPDGLARLVVDHRGLAYPIVADFSVFANAAQTLAAPPTIIKGRALVLLDTSGSMLWHFGDDTGTGGDSDATALFCDNNIGTAFNCQSGNACTVANGGINFWPTTLANPSRMYASKAALQNVINANSGLIDFGLERFLEDTGTCPNGTNPAYCCDTQIDNVTAGRCANRGGYSQAPNQGENDLTYSGSCGSTAGGGRILVPPAAGSGPQLLRWVDFTEDFCSSTGAVEGAPRNPEIRADGSTPLARAIINARTGWYQPIYNDSRLAGVQANDDPLIDCRPYSLIVMSDGADTCNGQQDCNNNDGNCGSANCTDIENGTNTDWRCACNANSQCTAGGSPSCDMTIHAEIDCSNDVNAACVSGACADRNPANGNGNLAYRCICTTNAQCGASEVCNTNNVQTIDCNNTAAQCTAPSVCRLLGSDDSRCSCTTNADCGTGSTCNTADQPRFDCQGSNAACNFTGFTTGSCVNAPGPGDGCVCTTNAQCAPGMFCSAGFCNLSGTCRTAGICETAGICTESTPRTRVQQVTDVWQQPTPSIPVPNPVKTYVLGMGNSYQNCANNAACTSGTCTSGHCTCNADAQCAAGFACDATGFCTNPSLNVPELNAMAIAGGTTQARFASSQTEIEAAFADIVAQTVKYEVCNALDDNCNVRVDEGLGVYQECTTAGGGATGASTDCGSNNCNAGRCTCTANNQCAQGYICGVQITGESARFCKPSCTVGLGACQQTGVKKCGAAANQCCVNNNSATCTTLNPLPGSPEVCNMLDDNCNGLIDENIPGGCPVCIPQDEVCDGDDDNCNGINDDGLDGQPCGTDVGLCTGGMTQCPPGGGTITCQGSTGPVPEVCNGYDDNCDNVTDGMSRPCYTGMPASTENVGVCHGGTQICTAVVNSGIEQWGGCVGQKLPTTEVCNGLNDDCDCDPQQPGCVELVDEGIPAPGGGGAVTGDPCCPTGTTLTGGECCAPNTTCVQPDSLCRAGTYQCSGSVVVCGGAVGPSNEICNMLDDNCNGQVDDLPGRGTPCQLPNSCAGILDCDYATGSLGCMSTGNMTGELCNNLDDDCDGSIDEIPDVLSDPNLMGECNPPPQGSVEPCMPGHWVCKGGQRQCEGFVHPRTEVCNGIDDDCDGEADTPNPCPGATLCMAGVCREPCRSGEFPCPGGQICEAGFCIPDPGGSGGSTGTGGSGQGGSGTGGSTTTTGGSSNVGGGLGSGGDMSLDGGMGDAGETSTGGSSATGGSTGNAGTPPVVKQEIDTRIYGLATGGGGCGCKVAGASPREKLFGVLLAAGLAIVLARRRRARLTPALAQGGGAK